MGVMILNGIPYAGGGSGSDFQKTGKIPYLKSSGTQYIDTGIKPSEKISIVADFFIDIDQLDKSESWVSVFGGNDGNVTNSIVFSFNPSSSTITYQDGSAYGDVGSRFVTPIDIHRTSIVKGVTSFDKYTMHNWTVNTFSSSHNIYLFASNTNGTVANISSICMTRCKIYYEDELISDFVPKEDNGEACFYNEVTKTYFKNQGTGDFIYGELSESMIVGGQIKGMSYVEVVGTLEAGETSLTLEDESITIDSTLDFYTDTFGVNPTAISVSTGSVTLTFEEQSSDVNVKVRVS